MKNIFLFSSILRTAMIATIISFTVYTNAQNVAINTSGNSADASAMLDVSSTSKGFLPPRMTTIQRTGIPSPASGLMVYDSDTKSYWYYSDAWKEVANPNSAGLALPYSASASNATKLFSVSNNGIVAGATALYGRASTSGSGIFPFYSMGVWGDNSIGVGVMGSSNNIGVLGSSGNATGGIGVLGTSSSTEADRGAVTGKNNSTGIAVFAESANGTAVYGKTTKQNGAAIYGINNSIQGHGVRGAAAGNDGVGIYGDAGISNSNSYAAYFRNWNAANSKNVVQIDNLGTGNFLALTDGLGDTKTMITKNGSISTDGNIFTNGAVVVRGNKGIIRNSNGNQLRIELKDIIIPAYQFQDFGEFADVQYVTYTFATPFPSNPAVMFTGNTEIIGTGWLLTPEISEVTTTGFTVRVSSGNATNTPNKTIKVIILGEE